MPYRRAIPFVSLPFLLALLLSTVFAQDSPNSTGDDKGASGSAAKLCFKCKRTGKIACTQHKPEEDAQWCSVYLNKPCCLGLGFTICQKCKIEEAIAEWDDLKKKRDEWLAARTKFDKETGEPLVHLENPHFRFACGLREVSTKEARLDAHKSAHLYLSRLEATWDLYAKTLDVSKEPKVKQDIFVFDRNDSFTKFLRKYVGESGGKIAGQKLFGIPSRYVTYRNPDLMPTDEDLHSNVVHNTAHLLIHGYKKVDISLPGWLDEGFAYYCEWVLTKETKCTCFVEVPPDSPWKTGDWKSRIYKSVVKKDNRAFSEVSGKELNGMDYEDMALSFSYVDFLATKEKEGFQKLVDAVKAGKKTPDALRDSLHWVPAEFEDNWRAWVLRAYATK